LPYSANVTEQVRPAFPALRRAHRRSRVSFSAFVEFGGVASRRHSSAVMPMTAGFSVINERLRFAARSSVPHRRSCSEHRAGGVHHVPLTLKSHAPVVAATGLPVIAIQCLPLKHGLCALSVRNLLESLKIKVIANTKAYNLLIEFVLQMKRRRNYYSPTLKNLKMKLRK